MRKRQKFTGVLNEQIKKNNRKREKNRERERNLESY